jgi:hypothetical protein
VPGLCPIHGTRAMRADAVESLRATGYLLVVVVGRRLRQEGRRPNSRADDIDAHRSGVALETMTAVLSCSSVSTWRLITRSVRMTGKEASPLKVVRRFQQEDTEQQRVHVRAGGSIQIAPTPAAAARARNGLSPPKNTPEARNPQAIRRSCHITVRSEAQVRRRHGCDAAQILVDNPRRSLAFVPKNPS